MNVPKGLLNFSRQLRPHIPNPGGTLAGFFILTEAPLCTQLEAGLTASRETDKHAHTKSCASSLNSTKAVLFCTLLEILTEVALPWWHGPHLFSGLSHSTLLNSHATGTLSHPCLPPAITTLCTWHTSPEQCMAPLLSPSHPLSLHSQEVPSQGGLPDHSNIPHHFPSLWSVPGREFRVTKKLAGFHALTLHPLKSSTPSMWI